MSGPASDLVGGALVAGRYRVLERLGAGGMGVVHRAHDTRLKRDVALKQVLFRRPDEDEAAEARRRMLREAQIAARVHHPRIVTVFDVLDEPGGPLLVLEYLPSRSLDELVAEAGVLTPGAAARAGAQIAEALTAAHAGGIVHRDVKPGNVLVGPGDPVGSVKLNDFGISQLPDTTTLTSSGIGTPAYFSPEVARGERATAASDVYALGATLCVAVQGAPPFGWGDGNPLELIRRIGQEPVPVPSADGSLGELLARMTDEDQHRRPTAAQAATLLWALADRPEPLHPVEPDEPGAGVEPTPHPPGLHATTQVPPGPARRRPWYRRGVPAVATALLAAAAVTGAVLVATHRTDGSEPAFPSAIPALTIGDEHTADPCSLVAPESLSRYGEATIVPDYGFFASCSVQVVPPGTPQARRNDDSVVVSVEFHPSSDSTPQGTPEQVGIATVFREPEESGGCHRYIALADASYLDISVSDTTSGRPLPDPACTIDEIATASAATTLAERGIGRRAPPPGTLWTTDACALLTPGDLTFLPLDRRASGRRGFAGWSCDWDDGTEDGPHITLTFDRFDAPSEVGTPVPGTPVFQRPGTGRTCDAEVAERNFTGSADRPFAELLRVKAQGPGSTRELCARAVALANAARLRV